MNTDHRTGIKHRIAHPRDLLVEMMDRVYRYGMTTTSGGNLSLLDEDGTMWITPGGVDKALFTLAPGLIMVPAMIYLLGMPTAVVVGTSLFQIIFVTANVTLLQSVQTQTVDFVLAGLLLLGAVIGAQFGSRFGARLRGEQLRGLLALMVLAVCIKIMFDLAVVPEDLLSVELLR